MKFNEFHSKHTASLHADRAIATHSHLFWKGSEQRSLSLYALPPALFRSHLYLTFHRRHRQELFDCISMWRGTYYSVLRQTWMRLLVI
jgi:hypothetical protein